MKLSQEIVVNDMHKIKHILAETYGIESWVEYPGFLVIEMYGMELHAGYYFDDDEANDSQMFEIYDYTDGARDGFQTSFETFDDLRFIARKLHDALLMFA